MTSDKAKRFLVLIIIINMALMGVFGAFFYYIKVENEEASSLSYDLEEKRADKNELSLLDRAFRETENDRKELNTHFVRSGDIDTFIENIISLGKETGITVTLQGLTETVDDTLTIDLRGAGAFQDLFYFIKLIEHVPYRLEFKKVFLNAGPVPEDSADARSWDASLTLLLYGFVKE